MKLNINWSQTDIYYFVIELIFLLFTPALKGQRRKIYLFPLGLRAKQVDFENNS
jgi:hypothetical protein